MAKGDRRQKNFYIAPELDDLLRVLCQIDGRDQQDFIAEAVNAAVLRRAADPEFLARLAEHRGLLDRLSEPRSTESP